MMLRIERRINLLSIYLSIPVGNVVAQGGHDGQMAGGPLVEVERPHPRDVAAQVAVDAWALDADEDAEVEARPVGVWKIISGIFRAGQ